MDGLRGLSEVLSLSFHCPSAVDGVELVGGSCWESVAEAYFTGTSMHMRGRREDLVPLPGLLPSGFMVTKEAKCREQKNTNVSLKNFKGT